jgi:hypothetical protein
VGESRAVRVRDLDLFAPPLFLAADFSKDRKDHRQPITRELAEKLKALARHSKAVLTMETYAAADPRLLRETVLAAEVLVKTATDKAVWSADGTQQAAQAGGSPVALDGASRFRQTAEVGDTNRT